MKYKNPVQLNNEHFFAAGPAVEAGPDASVAACLKYQSVVPVCMSAFRDFREMGPANARVMFDARIEEQLKLWIDAPLLIEALVDLLRFAALHMDEGSIAFSLTYDGINDFLIAIAWPFKAGETEVDLDRFTVPVLHNSRTEAIISQHGFAVDFRRHNGRATIKLCFRR